MSLRDPDRREQKQIKSEFRCSSNRPLPIIRCKIVLSFSKHFLVFVPREGGWHGKKFEGCYLVSNGLEGRKMLKTIPVHKTPGSLIIRLGMALTLLASLIGFMAASASGETWWPLGGGMDADVYALAYDNSGSVFAGGSFNNAGAGSANRIAEWDGSAWSPLGSGMSSDVYALAATAPGTCMPAEHSPARAARRSTGWPDGMERPGRPWEAA
jgi:hypothetical protein